MGNRHVYPKRSKQKGKVVNKNKKPNHTIQLYL